MRSYWWGCSLLLRLVVFCPLFLMCVSSHAKNWRQGGNQRTLKIINQPTSGIVFVGTRLFVSFCTCWCCQMKSTFDWLSECINACVILSPNESSWIFSCFLLNLFVRKFFSWLTRLEVVAIWKVCVCVLPFDVIMHACVHILSVAHCCWVDLDFLLLLIL